MLYFHATHSVSHCPPEGIPAQQDRKDDGPRGLGDFQRRLNRDQVGRGGRRDWEATPRSERGGSREEAPSVRVPNVGWDETPRNGPGWGSSRNKRWDAPTPRAGRANSPDNDDGAPVTLDMREWEEEQIKLDRDWYMGPEEGNMAGDDDYNPLLQYEDLAPIKEAELAKRAVVCFSDNYVSASQAYSVFQLSQKKISARQAQYVSHMCFIRCCNG